MMKTMRDIIDRIYEARVRQQRDPIRVALDPVSSAILTAHNRFYGRNWRRIKREVNKAVKAAKKGESQ